jgi:hypothetical protein
MEESIDELMMMVSSEMNWTVSDMIAMDIIRFLKIVNKVKKKIRARNEAIEKSNKSSKK